MIPKGKVQKDNSNLSPKWDIEPNKSSHIFLFFSNRTGKLKLLSTILGGTRAYPRAHTLGSLLPSKHSVVTLQPNNRSIAEIFVMYKSRLSQKGGWERNSLTIYLSKSGYPSHDPHPLDKWWKIRKAFKYSFPRVLEVPLKPLFDNHSWGWWSYLLSITLCHKEADSQGKCPNHLAKKKGLITVP